MTRLTYKDEEVYGGYSAVETDEFACVGKLGQLEDIEERLQKYKEFGINDLVSLFSKLNDEDIERFVLMTFKKERIISQKIFPNSNLQQYRQIEEELGIELITLFKALKNGIYVKQGKKILKKEIKDIRYSKGLTVHYELNGKQYDKIGAIMILYSDYNSQYCDFTNVYTYGRDWALTKEEL